MAEDRTVLADRVFSSVLAPLVLGGALRPAHPIGARAALALVDLAPRPSDGDLASRVELSRVVQARRLAPLDSVGDPTGTDLALGAVVHDLLQVTNPSWIRRSAPRRLLDLACATLDRLSPPTSAREALERHTWFARIFALRRRDTAVSWWVGSSTFRGKEPPKRLFLWPDLRRVHVARTEPGLMELLESGGPVENAPRFSEAVGLLLRATPLTDLATCSRSAPEFVWTRETLAMARAPVARTLALRAIALPLDSGASVEDQRAGHQDDVDAALGRATRALFAAKAWKDATTALDFLGHRAMTVAQAPSSASTEANDDTAFARAAGAMVARRWLDDPSVALTEAERRRLAPIFDAAGRASAARELAELSAPHPASPRSREEEKSRPVS